MWTDYRNVFSFEPGVYAQHASGNAQPAAGWPAAGVAFVASAAGQIVLSDGSGGVFLVTGGWDWYGHVLIRHVGPDGQTVAPWPANGVRISILSGPEPNSLRPAEPSEVEGAGPGDIMPSVALDGAGGLLVSWTHVSRSAQCVHVMKLSSAGTFDPSWPWSGAIVWPGYETQFQSCVTSDGQGGAFVAWDDEAGGVMVGHVLSNGTIDARWPVGGLSVSEPAPASSAPGIVSDEQGGCFVTWQQSDGTGASHPAIQHLLADGGVAPGWAAHGSTLTTEPTEPGSFRTYQGYAFAYSSVTSDGSGGVLFAWAQGTPGGRHIYAQRIFSGGSSGSGSKRYEVATSGGWGEDGVPVAASGSDDGLPTIVPDGSGGAFLAWQSVTATGDNEIFAQRVDAGGATAAGWPTEGFLIASGPGTRQHPVVAADGSGGALVAWEDSRDGVSSIFMGRANPAVAAVPIASPANRLTLEGIRPNPSVAGPLRVEFSLPNSDRATLELMDLAGRRVIEVEVGELGAGAHVATLEAPRSLQAGVYWLSLRQDDGEVAKRCAVIR